MIDFSVEPAFQAKLDWMKTFIDQECQAMDVLWPGLGANFDTGNEAARRHLKPLQDQVRAQGLWACHLGPQLGGPGYGQVKLALMNELIGRSRWAPSVFGTAAPDTGNAEILAMFGTDEQKARYLQPLMDGAIVSCFSMTEPQAGADPGEFTCRATRDGAEWVIEGEKWFSSNARYAAFFLVIAVTDPDKPVTERMSMFGVRPRRRESRSCATLRSSAIPIRKTATTVMSATTGFVSARPHARRAWRGVQGGAGAARRRARPPRHADRRLVPARAGK